jgi:hypothetical protein
MALAAVVSVFSNKCAYVVSVTTADPCPRRRLTVNTSTPLAMSAEA